MWLRQVLAEVKKDSAAPNNLHAEHLFKLNEAVFNLPEEDTMDPGLASKIFQTVEKIRNAYNDGKFDNADSNFFYDYLALLGTMQNQHFFSHKQTEKMLGWIKEVVDGGMDGALGETALEAENARLKKKIEELEGAVEVIRSYDKEMAAKAKAKAKSKAAPEPAAKDKGKGKVKGKGKTREDTYEEAPTAKSSGGKAKGKGKGKASDPVPTSRTRWANMDYEEEEAPPKRQIKGQAKGKDGKKGGGKSKAREEEAPPLRAPKGKGKGKGKGSAAPAEPQGKGSKGKSKGKWQARQ